MKTIVEAINTPNVYQFPDFLTGVGLRIYANAPFITYNGQPIPAGHPNTPNSWYLPVACEIQGGNILYIPSFEIDSTEDSWTDRSATYTAWLFANGERVGNVPFLAGFAVPALIDPQTLLAVNQTWGSLTLHRDARNPPPRQGVYDIGQVEYLIAAALTFLRMASETQVGMVALQDDPVDPSFPIALGPNSPLVPREVSGGGDVLVAGQATTIYSAVVKTTSMILPIPIADTITTPRLRIEKIVENYSFDVRSENEFDEGAFGWLIWGT